MGCSNARGDVKIVTMITLEHPNANFNPSSDVVDGADLVMPLVGESYEHNVLFNAICSTILLHI